MSAVGGSTGAAQSSPKGSALGGGRLADYQIGSKLGVGAQGAVYKAVLVHTGETVAIKQIDIANLSDKEKRAALNEVRVLSQLRDDPHPYLMLFREAFVEEKALHIVLEWCPQGTLQDAINKHRQNSTWFSENDIWAILISMASGLFHLHYRKILHRDLKPANIFLTSRKNEVQLGDFGVSCILEDRSKAQTVVGTPYYLSPELCLGKKYTSRSDVWSLGVVLYILLNDKMPFNASNYAALILRIVQQQAAKQTGTFSPELHRMATWCMQKDDTQRPDVEKLLLHPNCVEAAMRLDIHLPSEVVTMIESSLLRQTVPKPKVSQSPQQQPSAKKFGATAKPSPKLPPNVAVGGGAPPLPMRRNDVPTAGGIANTRIRNRNPPTAVVQRHQRVSTPTASPAGGGGGRSMASPAGSKSGSGSCAQKTQPKRKNDISAVEALPSFDDDDDDDEEEETSHLGSEQQQQQHRPRTSPAESHDVCEESTYNTYRRFLKVSQDREQRQHFREAEDGLVSGNEGEESSPGRDAVHATPVASDADIAASIPDDGPDFSSGRPVVVDKSPQRPYPRSDVDDTSKDVADRRAPSTSSSLLDPVMSGESVGGCEHDLTFQQVAPAGVSLDEEESDGNAPDDYHIHQEVEDGEHEDYQQSGVLWKVDGEEGTAAPPVAATPVEECTTHFDDVDAVSDSVRQEAVRGSWNRPMPSTTTDGGGDEGEGGIVTPVFNFAVHEGDRTLTTTLATTSSSEGPPVSRGTPPVPAQQRENYVAAAQSVTMQSDTSTGSETLLDMDDSVTPLEVFQSVSQLNRQAVELMEQGAAMVGQTAMEDIVKIVTSDTVITGKSLQEYVAERVESDKIAEVMYLAFRFAFLQGEKARISAGAGTGTANV